MESITELADRLSEDSTEALKQAEGMIEEFMHDSGIMETFGAMQLVAVLNVIAMNIAQTEIQELELEVAEGEQMIATLCSKQSGSTH